MKELFYLSSLLMLFPVIILYTKRFDSRKAFLTDKTNRFIFLSYKEELAIQSLNIITSSPTTHFFKAMRLLLVAA